MILLDTSVLIDAFVHQNSVKQAQAKKCLEQVIEQQALLLSPLILTEFSFVLSKLNLFNAHQETIDFLQSFVNFEIDRKMLIVSLQRASELGTAKHINDLLHLAYAERFCKKLITFDKDFQKFKHFTHFEIDILCSSGTPS